MCIYMYMSATLCSLHANGCPEEFPVSFDCLALNCADSARLHRCVLCALSLYRRLCLRLSVSTVVGFPQLSTSTHISHLFHVLDIRV